VQEGDEERRQEEDEKEECLKLLPVNDYEEGQW